MDCKDLTSDLLLDLADRSLPEARKPAVEEHITACRGCRVRFEEVRSLAVGLRRSMEVPAQPALMQQLDAAVLESIRRDWRSPRERRSFSWWILGTVAAVALVAIGVAAVLNNREVPTPSVRPAGIVHALAAPAPVVATKEEIKPVLVKGTTPVLARQEAIPVTALPPVDSLISLPRPPQREVIQKHKTIPGDVNGDGRVDSADSLMLMDYLVNGGAIDLEAADFDGNGRIDIGDALAIAEEQEESP